jgi:hypothetical protein
VIFQRAGNEILRLPGVSRPEVFRQMCLTAQQALVSVRDEVQRQSLGAG